MKHGTTELNKLLDIFENMSISEYLDLYNQSLLKDSIFVIDGFIDTDISYVSNYNKIDIDLFTANLQKIIIENEPDSILCLKPNTLKAA
jgi:hypothetical protein